MKIERLMDIVTKYCFLFAIMSFVFSDEINFKAEMFVFLAACLITFLIFAIFKVNKIISAIIIVLAALIPILFIKGSVLIIFILFSAIFAFVYVLINKKELVYGSYKDSNSRIIFFLLIAAFFGIFDLETFARTSVPFLCIYVLVYTVLLRLLRCKKYNRDNKKIYKINAMYLVMILIPPVLLGIDAVSKWFLKALKFLYLRFCDVFQYIIWAIAYIIYYLLIGITYIGKKILALLLVKGKDKSESSSLGRNVDNEKVKKEVFNFFYSNSALGTILKIVLIAVVIIIIAKIISKKKKKELDIVQDYTEDKQIVNEKNSLLDKLRPKTYSERIRSYYLNFMKFSFKKGIKLNNSDTTLDINKKAGVSFDNVLINKLRSLYIKVRYSNYAADKNDAKEASDYLKEIKNTK